MKGSGLVDTKRPILIPRSVNNSWIERLIIQVLHTSIHPFLSPFSYSFHFSDGGTHSFSPFLSTIKDGELSAVYAVPSSDGVNLVVLTPPIMMSIVWSSMQ